VTKFPSTILPAKAEALDMKKASLDLLDKINRVVGETNTVSSQVTTVGTQVTTLSAQVAATGLILHVREVQAYNVDGGTFTSGADRTRVLNTVVTNTISGASLASNQIVLPAGTYDVEWSAPAKICNAHFSHLYDTTGAAKLLDGTTEFVNSAVPVVTRSLGRGRITLTVTSALEIRHRCQTTRNTDGLGNQTTVSGYDSIYTDVVIKTV
jgi:hypothetical protein